MRGDDCLMHKYSKTRFMRVGSFYLIILAAIALVSVDAVRSAQEGTAVDGTLEAARSRGFVNCGVNAGVAGFAIADKEGNWSGLDIDFCAALATAVFGKRDAVKYIPLKIGNAFRALATGDVDVLARGRSWTLSRDTELGVSFAGVTFYDGLGFLARRNQVISSVFALSGASICVVTGTQAVRSVSDFFQSRKMTFQLVKSESWKDLVEIYGKGGCTVLAGESAMLATARLQLERPDDHTILPELISKEPLGPVVRADDNRWFSIVRWTLMALVAGEELGLSNENIAAMRGSKILAIRRFMGIEANLGVPLGLEKDWAYQVIRQVGNYGDIFVRNLGAKSKLGLQRGLNKLWNQGGLHYSAPFR
ncbi:MAG: amino acid ABC transporter substrate-binding protein [Hyphomicrobiaceae bacterium]